MSFRSCFGNHLETTMGFKGNMQPKILENRTGIILQEAGGLQGVIPNYKERSNDQIIERIVPSNVEPNAKARHVAKGTVPTGAVSEKVAGIVAIPLFTVLAFLTIIGLLHCIETVSRLSLYRIGYNRQPEKVKRSQLLIFFF